MTNVNPEVAVEEIDSVVSVVEIGVENVVDVRSEVAVVVGVVVTVTITVSTARLPFKSSTTSV